MRELMLAGLVMALGASASGCGPQVQPIGEGGDTISCATPAGFGHECITYGGVVSTEDCIGKVEVVSCPAGVGTCTLLSGADGIEVATATTYYSDYGSSDANLEAACTGIGGTWSP